MFALTGEHDVSPSQSNNHTGDSPDQEPESTDPVNNGHTSEGEHGITTGGNETGTGGVAETEQTKYLSTVVEQRVESGQMNENLDTGEGNDGPSVWLVRPASGSTLLESVLTLENCGCVDNVLQYLHSDCDQP